MLHIIIFTLFLLAMTAYDNRRDKGYGSRICLNFLLTMFLVFALPVQAQNREIDKIRYELATDIVVSDGKNAPFWLISNRHGLSSIKNNNVNLSAAFFRDFDKKKGFAWAYGAEIATAWNYPSTFFIQQLYADIRYNYWELSIGSKERLSEGKHHTLSGGGLTFSSNSRPIPQIRFGINDYVAVPWLFNGWLQVKGHISYGRQTDDKFQQTHINDAPYGSRYAENILFHEKTAFIKIGKPTASPFSVEMGLEMYTQFGGRIWEKGSNGDFIRYDLPHTYKEYIKAFIPMAAGSDSPEMEQENVNGNVLGSWHLALGYEVEEWKIKAYYEHFYEDHSGLLGFDYHSDRNGKKRFVTYLPWRDGLYGLQLTVPKNSFINTIVYEYLTSMDQGGPILQNPAGDMTGQAGGKDWYYNHTYYQSWQHWGMAICNPHTLSPLYNKVPNLTMPYQRIRSHHIGIDGMPSGQFHYRIMLSHTKHWGSYEDPLSTPLTQLSTMGEICFIPRRPSGLDFTLSIAYDHSKLIGNNFGGMLTIRKSGWLSNKNK